jgi:hypothetical protein
MQVMFRAGWLLVKGAWLKLLLAVVRTFSATPPDWLDRMVSRFERDCAAVVDDLEDR